MCSDASLNYCFVVVENHRNSSKSKVHDCIDSSSFTSTHQSTQQKFGNISAQWCPNSWVTEVSEACSLLTRGIDLKALSWWHVPSPLFESSVMFHPSFVPSDRLSWQACWIRHSWSHLDDFPQVLKWKNDWAGNITLHWGRGFALL